MKRSELYRLLLLCGVHLELREAHPYDSSLPNQDELVEKVALVRKISDELEGFRGVLNKKQACDRSREEYAALMRDGIDDQVLTAHVLRVTEDESSENKAAFFDGLIWIALRNDENITKDELDFLSYLYSSLKIGTGPLEKYISQRVKRQRKHKRKAILPGNENRSKLPLVFSLLLLVMAIAGAIWVGVITRDPDFLLKKRSLSNLSYKKIYFERYIAVGNFKGGERADELGKLSVFYIRGSADVQFDLEKIHLNRTRGGMEAVCASPLGDGIKDGEVIPYSIDVNIDQKDYTEVLSVDPQGLSGAQAAIPASIIGTVAGVGGVYIGAKTGSLIGGITGDPVFKLAGGGVGALLGGAAAGIGGFVLTKNMLTGMQLTGPIMQSTKEEILKNAKTLIAAELLFDQDLSRELKAAFEDYVRSFFQSFGTEINTFRYTTKI